MRTAANRKPLGKRVVAPKKPSRSFIGKVGKRRRLIQRIDLFAFDPVLRKILGGRTCPVAGISTGIFSRIVCCAIFTGFVIVPAPIGQIRPVFVRIRFRNHGRLFLSFFFAELRLVKKRNVRKAAISLPPSFFFIEHGVGGIELGMILKQSSVQRQSLLRLIRLKALDNHVIVRLRRGASFSLPLSVGRNGIFFSFYFLRHLHFTYFCVVKARITEFLQNTVHQIFGRTEKTFSVIFRKCL